MTRLLVVKTCHTRIFVRGTGSFMATAPLLVVASTDEKSGDTLAESEEIG